VDADLILTGRDRLLRWDEYTNDRVAALSGGNRRAFYRVVVVTWIGPCFVVKHVRRRLGSYRFATFLGTIAGPGFPAFR
jgi:hypothetical protein